MHKVSKRLTVKKKNMDDSKKAKRIALVLDGRYGNDHRENLTPEGTLIGQSRKTSVVTGHRPLHMSLKKYQ